MSVEAFAQQKGISEENVITMIKDGFYVGRKIQDDWFVEEAELSGPEPTKNSNTSSLASKVRLFFSVVACGLVMLGISSHVAGEPIGITVLSTPGAMLATYLFLTSPTKHNAVNAMTQVDQLTKWHSLKESGAISEAEYRIKKFEIFN